jgi:hypothetical protein
MMNGTILRTVPFSLHLTSMSALLIWTPPQAQSQSAGWTNRFHGPLGGADHASALAISPDGTVFVSGTCNGTYHDYATVAYSSAGVPLWTNFYNGLGNGEDYVSGAAVDGSGRVFVTGFSQSASATLPSNFDYATIAYSSDGLPLWTNWYNGPSNGDDHARAIAVDGSGNVFVTGTSCADQNDCAYATVGYSNTGTPLWTNQYIGPGRDHEATAIAVDRNGNVFVTGYSLGDTTSYYDIATVAYSGNGTPLWTNRYNGPGNSWDQGNAIAVDTNGNVFVTGFSIGAGGPNALKDYVTLAYSSAGAALWTNRYHGPGANDDVAQSITTDVNDDVIVTGQSYGSGTGYDYATIKYSNTGVPIWTNRYNGPTNRNDYAYALGSDSAGNVFVTGSSLEATNFYSDYATVAYSSAGVPRWTQRYHGYGTFSDTSNALAVDRSGNVIVAGDSSNGNNLDFLTIKYPAGSTSAPILTVTRSGPGSTFQLTWPSALSLQQNTNLAIGSGWLPYPGAVNDNGNTKSITVEPSSGILFFSLSH